MVDIVGMALNTVIRRVFDVIERKLIHLRFTRETVEVHLDQHLKRISSWSGQIQHLGMPDAAATDNATVALDLISGARRFRPYNSKAPSFHEDALLEDSHHYVLVGDPGAGKTTTLKRLVRRLFLMASNSPYDTFQYPLVIFSKDLDIHGGLYSAIVNALGVPNEKRYRTRDGVVHTALPTVRLSEDVDTEQSKKATGPLAYDVLDYIGGEPAIRYLQSFLNESGCVLFVDGLDECSRQTREKTEEQLTELAHLLDAAKIVVSCRTGDYSKHIEGFSVSEILPLSAVDIKEIISRWLGSESASFQAALEKKTYFDLADRPLFLVNLILIFQMGGYLPDKSVDVYRRIIVLILERWDEHRGIHRQSKYSLFLPERKIDFLSELAWELLYERQTGDFSEEMLKDIYRKLSENYELPVGEARLVVQEIESHTGLLVMTGYQTYAFSHLTLLEYLAANFIIRQPFIRNFEYVFATNPAPFAIAVALSSDPALWFSNLILRHEQFSTIRRDRRSILSFISRLVVEGVRFRKSDVLGIAVAALESSYWLGAGKSGNGEQLDTFIRRMGCLDSIALGLRNYKKGQEWSDGSGIIELNLIGNRMFELPVPTSLYLRKALLDRVMK